MRRHGVVASLAVLLLSAWAFSADAAEIKEVPAPAAEKVAPAAAKAEPVPPVKHDVVGAPLPPMSIKTVTGDRTIALDKMGKPALIVFISSTCSACRGELSTLSGMAEKYKGKLEALVVTVDFDPQNTLLRLPSLAKMPFTLLDGSDFKLANVLGFNFTPATVVADASGKQVLRKGGYVSGEEAVIVQAVVNLMK